MVGTTYKAFHYIHKHTSDKRRYDHYKNSTTELENLWKTKENNEARHKITIKHLYRYLLTPGRTDYSLWLKRAFLVPLSRLYYYYYYTYKDTYKSPMNTYIVTQTKYTSYYYYY